jgi:phage-related protein
MTEIEFYVKENGRIPVQEFLDGLSPRKDLPYINKALQRLREYGHTLPRPHAAYLRDDIYELRVRTINGQFRIFYFFFDGDKIILTHGMKKKTAVVPANQIDYAVECRKNFLQRNEKRK